jgi:hypothetical protein
VRFIIVHTKARQVPAAAETFRTDNFCYLKGRLVEVYLYSIQQPVLLVIMYKSCFNYVKFPEAAIC